MDNTNMKRNDEGKQKKRKNEGISKRKDTLIKKVYELEKLDDINIALIIYKYDRYIIYRSKNYALWPPSIAEIVNKSNCLLEILN
jgi:hypothetical protein